MDISIDFYTSYGYIHSVIPMTDERKEEDFGDLVRGVPAEKDMTGAEVRDRLEDAILALRAVDGWVDSRGDALLSAQFQDTVRALGVLVSLCALSDMAEGLR